MVIEWLRFRVDPDRQDYFVEQDLAHWTEALAQQPGFMGKEVWTNPAIADELILVIRWHSQEQWKAISPTFLAAIAANFRQAMGEADYSMLESSEYHLHRFPHVHVSAPKP